MKRILSIVFILCLNFAARSQWPINQNIGSDSTMVRVGPTKSGGLWGGLVVRAFSDTTAANLTRIRQYEGGLLFTTGDSTFWYRGPGATKWFRFGSNTVTSTGWNIGGNLFSVMPSPYPTIGTLSPWGGGFGIMTNSVVRAAVPDGGFTLSNDTSATKVFTWNPTTKDWGYANWNNGGSTPTWQQTLTAGSTLTGNNTVVLGGNTIGFTGGNFGIGTGSPGKVLHTVGTVRLATLGTASGDTTTYKPLGIDSNGDVIGMTNWAGSGGGITKSDANFTITSDSLSFDVWLNVSDFGAIPDDDIDDTPDIQEAIDSAFARGNSGAIYFPPGVYNIDGPLVDSVDGVLVNAQIYMPLVNAAGPGKTIAFIGIVPPSPIRSGLIDFPKNDAGAILKSSIIGSGTTPAVFGTSSYNTGFDFFNNLHVYMDNLNIQVRSKTSGGADTVNTMSGLNFQRLGTFQFGTLLINAESTIFDSEQPATGTYGLVMPKNLNAAFSYGQSLVVSTFDIGLVPGEHTTIETVTVEGCNVGVGITSSHAHPMFFSRLLSQWNITGIQYNGSFVIHISEYSAEHYTGAYGAKWYTFSKDINGVGGTIYGDMSYAIYESGSGLDNNDFTSDVSSSTLQTRPIGSAIVRSVAAVAGTSAEGAEIVNNYQIRLNPASSTTPGIISMNNQTFGTGTKYFQETFGSVVNTGNTSYNAMELKNSHVNGRVFGAFLGDSGTDSIYVGTYNSAFAVPALRGRGGIFGTQNVRIQAAANDASGASRSITFSTQGYNSTEMVLEGNGRLGIGIETPSELLHVDGAAQIGTAGSVLGQIKISGNTSGTITIQPAAAAGTWTATLPTTDGNAGEFMQTDGSGVLTWATPTGTLPSVGEQGTILQVSNGAAAWKYDTTTLVTFSAGARFITDTTLFTDSTLYGSFYLDGNDTLVITGLKAVMNGGTSDTLGIQVTYNDTINVTGSNMFTASLPINSTTTGTSPDADDWTGGAAPFKIPPGNWVWMKSPTVVAGRKPYYLSVSIIGYKKRVN